MCTLTYLPIRKGHFIWTHNRDEDPDRSVPGLIKDGSLCYPKDKRAGGTWIAANMTRIISLLNGAYHKQAYAPSRVKSRGLIVLDCMKMSLDDFFNRYDLEGIEPFTMVIWDSGKLYDFRWDKQHKFIEERDPDHPHIWSSVTLYNADQRNDREALFHTYFADNSVDPKHADLFHRMKGNDIDQTHAIYIDRAYVKTVSISQIIASGIHGFTMIHEDTKSGSIDREVVS